MATFKAAVAEVKSIIEEWVRPEIDVDTAAEWYVWRGIENGANEDGEMSAELRAFETRNGRPYPFTFRAVAD